MEPAGGTDKTQEHPQEIAIPEHDTITRRKQFRLKSNRQEQKRQKKEAKKAQKEAQMKEKENKRKAREEQKKTKADTKAAGKSKRGRKAKHVDAVHDAEHKTQEENGGTAQISEATEVSVHDTSSPKSPTKVRSPKLARLRKMKSLRKLGSKQPKATDPKPKSKGRKKAGSNTTGDKKAKTDCETKDPSKKRKRAPKDKQQEEKSPAKKPKRSNIKKAKKAPVMPDPKVKEAVCTVLHECRDSGCTHPGFTHPEFNKATFDLSVYWSRKAVGVKLHKDYLPSKTETAKNAKKSKAAVKKSQVAYFSCRTNCTYSNLLLAGLYVSCMHWCGLQDTYIDIKTRVLNKASHP